MSDAKVVLFRFAATVTAEDILVIPPETFLIFESCDGSFIVSCLHFERLRTVWQGEDCPAGSFCPSPAEVSTCTVGAYCPIGSDAAVACQDGSYCGALGQSSEEDCPAGSFCSTPAEVLTCTVGAYCPIGSVAAVACQDGSYCGAPGQSLEGGDCPSGSFCPTPAEKHGCVVGDFCVARST